MHKLMGPMIDSIVAGLLIGSLPLSGPSRTFPPSLFILFSQNRQSKSWAIHRGESHASHRGESQTTH